MDYILNIFITQSISRMHFGMYCMQASIPNVHLNDIYSKYERFHVKDKRKKEEIEYIYKTDKQGTRVTCRCIPIKGQTRELPEIEHARPDLAKKIKDNAIYQYIVRCGRIAYTQIFSEVYCLFSLLHCPDKFFDTNQLILFMTLCVCLLHVEDNTVRPSQL